MPKFEKLSVAEIERLKKRKSPNLDLSTYFDYLANLKVGDWGAITLEAGDRQRAIKRRLTMAAKQKGVNIRYRSAEEGRIVFEIR